MDNRGQFTFYRSFWDAVQGLPKKDRLPILEAIISYALDGKEPTSLSQSQAAFFLLCRPTLESSRRKAASGKQGGSKPKANGEQTPREKEGEKEEEKEIEVEIEGKSTARFKPPYVDEVRAYCQERQNGVDPQRFVDYYTSNGWMVGKNKMKDWKAAVRTWEQKETVQKPCHQQPQQQATRTFKDMLREAKGI